MLELDDLPPPGDLTELLRRTINGEELAVVHDREGHPVAVLVPWEIWQRVQAPPAAPDALTPEEEQQVQAIAAELRARGVTAGEDPHSPSAAVKADPA